jgi:DNA-binding transcriptional LysR family regulator
MRRDEIGELMALVAVAQERSFTRAAAKLGTSQSNLSATIRKLEERVGLKLLTRTTRSVAATAAGDRLLSAVKPAFEQVGAALTSLNDIREKPAGSFRITAGDHAANTLLILMLARLLRSWN